MSNYLDSQTGWLPPLIDDDAPAHHKPYILSGTGVGEESNDRPFTKDRMHWLIVGDASVRVGFSAKKGLSNVVDDTNSPALPPGTIFPFKTSQNSRFIYVEASDGSAAFEAAVIQREP